MTPRERLTEILKKRILGYLENEGFKFNPNNSQFTRTRNQIKQIIYFEGSKWNYADAVADYKLLYRLEIKKFPNWYLDNYETSQATHHQTKVSTKSVHQPSPSEGYTEKWNDYGQINGRYDLVKFSTTEVEENIYENISKCILPYLNDCSDYSGIADKAKHPLDKFDFYMMDSNVTKAKTVLNEALDKIRNINLEEFDWKDDFRRESLKNTLNMLNIRIDKFFPEIENINMEIPNN